MRIQWLLPGPVPEAISPLLRRVCGRLRSRGHAVEVVIPERELIELDTLRPRHDLYVLRSHTELALSIATALSAAGAAVLNEVGACVDAQDKGRATSRLRGAGVPVPQSFVTGSWPRVAGLAAIAPVVVKPLRGHGGAGVEVVRGAAEVRGRPEPRDPLLVQELIPGPGEDLEVYVVERRVWAVRRAFSPATPSPPRRPVTVSDEIGELAMRVAAASGLVAFGFDVVEGPEGPVVVDVDYLPGYEGCAGVVEPMTELVHRAAIGVGTSSQPTDPRRAAGLVPAQGGPRD